MYFDNFVEIEWNTMVEREGSEERKCTSSIMGTRNS